jgi:hypothetical protein
VWSCRLGGIGHLQWQLTSVGGRWRSVCCCMREWVEILAIGTWTPLKYLKELLIRRCLFTRAGSILVAKTKTQGSEHYFSHLLLRRGHRKNRSAGLIVLRVLQLIPFFL